MKLLNRNARAKLILSIFLFCAMIVFLYSCGSGGGGDNSSGASGKGAVRFNLEMIEADSSRALDFRYLNNSESQFECRTHYYSITTIDARVVGENNELLAVGGPWDCEDHEGNIGNVEAGTGRIVKIFANDENGTTLFRGQSEPLTVQVGQTVDAGTILLYPVYPPFSPKNLEVSKGQYSDGIRLKWDDVDNEDGYYIFRSPSREGSYSWIGETGVNTTFYDDSRPCGGGPDYWYVVRAFNIAGESDDSNTDSGFTGECPIYPPDPPADLDASDGDFEDKIRLTWSDVDDEDGYLIYRRADGIYSQIGQTDANTTFYDDSRPCGGDPVYEYVVTAFNIAGESRDSNTDRGRTDTCPRDALY